MTSIRPSAQAVAENSEIIVLTRLRNCVIGLVEDGYLPIDSIVLIYTRHGTIRDAEDVKILKPTTLRSHMRDLYRGEVENSIAGA